ncbi:hypothetical protein FB567DRAFT_529250 [Paraphoma chrysanthemicola]|uniref:Uncharacterized protein n=1 Tax=Paraphoma chrysanthemicola TaxID=798071 RepID=A0A8K0VY68_9PLEO|nr:hypothetical protein FB567DRAFT_529250 [Paraphoma chrysanthemicola]
MPTLHITVAQDADWHLPQTQDDKLRLQMLSKIVRTPDHVLLTDFEFGQCEDRTPSPFEVCVKRFRAVELIVDTHAKYPPFDFYDGTTAYWRAHFRSNYHGTKSYGKTLREIGDIMRSNGITTTPSTFYVLPWFATVDMICLRRMLAVNKETAIFDKKETWKFSCAGAWPRNQDHALPATQPGQATLVYDRIIVVPTRASPSSYLSGD